MAMHGAVAAKNQRRVRLIGGVQFIPRKNVNAGQREWPDVVLLRERRQHGNGPHGAKGRIPTQKIKIATSAQKFIAVFGCQLLTMLV
jgi:hypothetical protein